MPFDWVTFILLQNIGKPRAAKPQSKYKAVKAKERVDQEKRNVINRARITAYLGKQNGTGRFQ